MKTLSFAPILLAALGGLCFGGMGAACAQQAGRRPAIISYYFALPEEEADGVNFSERAAALQKKSAEVDTRHGFLRVSKVALRIFHRKFRHDIVAVLKGYDGNSLRLLSLERVQVDSHDQVCDAEWNDETENLLPTEFNKVCACYFDVRDDSVSIIDRNALLPVGKLVWTGSKFTLIRGFVLIASISR